MNFVRNLLAGIAVLSFIVISVFGFVGLMTHESVFMHCAKALAGDSAACQNAIEMGLLHVRIYQGFSLSLMAATVILIFAIFSLTYIAPKPKLLKISFGTNTEFVPNSYQERMYSWLSLRQSLDPLF